MLAPECCKMIGHVQGTCIHKIHHISLLYSQNAIGLQLFSHQLSSLGPRPGTIIQSNYQLIKMKDR